MPSPKLLAGRWTYSQCGTDCAWKCTELCHISDKYQNAIISSEQKIRQLRYLWLWVSVSLSVCLWLQSLCVLIIWFVHCLEWRRKEEEHVLRWQEKGSERDMTWYWSALWRGERMRNIKADGDSGQNIKYFIRRYSLESFIGLNSEWDHFSEWKAAVLEWWGK